MLLDDYWWGRRRHGHGRARWTRGRRNSRRRFRRLFDLLQVDRQRVPLPTDDRNELFVRRMARGPDDDIHLARSQLGWGGKWQHADHPAVDNQLGARRTAVDGKLPYLRPSRGQRVRQHLAVLEDRWIVGCLQRRGQVPLRFNRIARGQLRKSELPARSRGSRELVSSLEIREG